MSRLAEFRKLEQQLAAQLAELEALKNDSSLKQEMEFETRLRSLLAEYNYSLRDVISLLDPRGTHARKGAPVVAAKATRRARIIKVYNNPHTGERVETKGGNHKVLKEWKAEYGSNEVESWLAK